MAEDPTGVYLDAMHAEWLAWQKVGHEFEALKGAVVSGSEFMNEGRVDPLIRAIEYWGEELVALRLTQGEEVRTTAYAEKRTTYATRATPGFK